MTSTLRGRAVITVGLAVSARALPLWPPELQMHTTPGLTLSDTVFFMPSRLKQGHLTAGPFRDAPHLDGWPHLPPWGEEVPVLHSLAWSVRTGCVTSVPLSWSVYSGKALSAQEGHRL